MLDNRGLYVPAKDRKETSERDATVEICSNAESPSLESPLCSRRTVLDRGRHSIVGPLHFSFKNCHVALDLDDTSASNKLGLCLTKKAVAANRKANVKPRQVF